jgi:hypothetical protein
VRPKLRRPLGLFAFHQLTEDSNMAVVTKDPLASMDASNGMFGYQITGDFYAGEALPAASPVYIKSADGKVYMSNGTAANEAATFFGFTPKAYSIGQAVAIFGLGSRFRYGTGLTIGAKYFVAATAGALDTAATTGGLTPVARAITATDIQVIAAY